MIMLNYISACHSSCLTCDSQTAFGCLTCEPTDMRILNAKKCECKEKYYDTNDKCESKFFNQRNNIFLI